MSIINFMAPNVFKPLESTAKITSFDKSNKPLVPNMFNVFILKHVSLIYPSLLPAYDYRKLFIKKKEKNVIKFKLFGLAMQLCF